MKKIIFTISLKYFYLFVVFSCFAQSPQPSRTPNQSDEETVKISTTLIQVDVTVTDKNGKLIKDLKPEEFEIFENGEKQEITNFSFVSAGAESSTAPKNKSNSQLPNSPIRPEQVRRTIALIVDDLTLNYEKVEFVRKALRKFVDEQMRDGDLVAITRTGGGTGIYEQFTSDRRQLRAAIEKIKWNPFGLGGPKFILPSSEISTGDATGLRDPNKEAEDFRHSVIAARTVGGLNYIISGMKNLPGRKSAIVFSEGFKIIKRDVVGPERDFRVQAALEKLLDAAARASVVVYTIDARGLETETNQDFNDQQDGLIFLAQQTGGTAIKNSNDFNLGIEKILDNQKDYYLIGYTPDGDTFDAAKHRFNTLTVKVKREGATVRYRSGFSGLRNPENENRINRTSSEQLKDALVSPFAASSIALNLNTLFANDDGQNSYVRSFLHINARDLAFTQAPDGNKKAVFDVLALSFNDEGAIVDKITKNYVLTLPVKEYEKLLAEGFVYYFTFPVRQPGAYQFRVAIRDKQSEKIGSASQFVEIPNLKKSGLTISGVVLENLTPEQWKTEEQSSQSSGDFEKNKNRIGDNLLINTALRQFKRDTVLRYGFEVYGAKLDSNRKPRLSTQASVFHDGKIILKGKTLPIELTEQKDQRKISTFGALLLGKEMPKGSYILQLTVTDESAKGKDKTAIQYVQFEIV